jgi:hypothetical protein
MTEQQWLACADGQTLLAFLNGKTTARKRYLLGCGCCRLFHGDCLEQHPDLLHRLETVERYADDAATFSDYVSATQLSTWAPGTQQEQAVLDWLRNPWHVATALPRPEVVPVIQEVFRPFAHRIKNSWLAWEGGLVAGLADSIYRGHGFGGLPILADALEDAGCTDQPLLDHLRGPGQHTRGCWALDLIVGKC